MQLQSFMSGHVFYLLVRMTQMKWLTNNTFIEEKMNLHYYNIFEKKNNMKHDY
jgi:hypothetical protein